MKKKLLFTAAAFALLNLGINAQTYSVKPNESNIKWLAKKVTGEHYGNVKIKEGQLDVKNGLIKSGSFIIDMTTINTTDLEGEWKQKLDGHLKNEDFFNVANYKTSTLKILSSKKNDKGQLIVTADLTIKGITNKIEFPVELNLVEKNPTAQANFDIDRTKWKVEYNSGNFFEGLGDKMIYDEINYDVTLKLSEKK